MTTSTKPAGYRVGIDVGGTFTDFVLADPDGTRIVRFKESSVPEDPSRSVERGLPQLIERAGISPADIDLIVHGTTLPLNAMIQRRGARVGLVVSRGNRGVLEIGRTQLSNAFSFLLSKEEPLVPRGRILEIAARIAADGEVIATSPEDEIARTAEALKAQEVEAVVVLMLNAFTNPEAEQEVAASLQAQMGDIPVSASSAIWPDEREFERGIIALINAYVQPIMTEYLDKLSTRVKGLGVEAPIYITSNNGGTLSLRTARDRPIDTILSGPASGVVAASVVSKGTPFGNLVTVDIGGTSADMSVIQDRTPTQTTATKIGPLPLTVPVVAVSAIGAGGGSIVWVDSQGAMKVGPQSAGASPGPACYGRGGTEATLTDCYLIAGYIDEKHFLGGRLKLDRAASLKALEDIADKVGLTGPDRAALAADAAIRITTAMMSSEIARSMARTGEDATDYTLVAYGGAGPTHAANLALDAGVQAVLIPTAPSTFCALGAILSDVKRDFLASVRTDLATPGVVATLGSIFADLRETANDWIRPDLDLLGEVRFEPVLDMRYAGQAYSLPVPVTLDMFDAGSATDPAALLELFHETHEKLYGYRDPDSDAEVTAERLRIISSMPGATLPSLEDKSDGAPIETRPIFVDATRHEADVWQRGDLAAGQVIAGPAIVEQEDTTTVILPTMQGAVDAAGNLILTTRSAA